MNDARTAFRALAIYAISIPLALVLGYLIANPLDLGSFTLIGFVILILCAPLLIQHHYPFMLLAWNMPVVLFFMPGRMNLWAVAIFLSFMVSFTHRILDKKVQFLSVPQLTRPLICLAVVVLFTMQLRGGLGLRSLGGSGVGGRNYVYVLLSILGYFALTVQKLPASRTNFWIGLFLLGGAASVIGDLYGRLPAVFDFVFLLIPPSLGKGQYNEAAITRLSGLASAGGAAFYYMLARHGIRGMLESGHRHRFVLFCGFGLAALFGGFRSSLITFGFIFAVQFWLEGLFRSKWVFVFGLAFVLAGAVVVPFTAKLPLGLQRTLAFLPVDVDPQARLDAAGSSEWRLQMWRAAIPMIPQYLLLGKGYSISQQDYDFMVNRSFGTFSVEERGSFVAGDFHSGPLSVIIPFGLWGAVCFLWFVGAGFWVLWRNYRHGDPAIRNANTFLLAAYIVATVMFFAVFGAFNSQMVAFAGTLGLSVALNGGVARPTVSPPFKPEVKPKKPGPAGIR